MKKKIGFIVVCMMFGSLDAAFFDSIKKKTKEKIVDPAQRGFKEKIIEPIKKVIEPTKSLFESLDAWVTPDPRLRWDQVACLASHNSHANREEGFIFIQQTWSIERQLAKGVRQLLLDLWKYKGEVLLCHGPCGGRSLLSRGGRKHHTFRSSLETVKRFLDTHPSEIVSLELENYVTGDETYKEILAVPGLIEYILIPRDYEPFNYGGDWPTLHWLQARNKRLIIFDTKNDSRYSFNTNRYMIRNMYGTLNLEKACVLRGGYRPNRQLYQLNFFGTIPSPLPTHNTPQQLKKVWERCEQKGVAPVGKTPNFISIDFVDRGNAMKWINEMNRNAALHL